VSLFATIDWIDIGLPALQKVVKGGIRRLPQCHGLVKTKRKLHRCILS